MEKRLEKILFNLGDLIHNGVNGEFSSINEEELCRLGILTRNVTLRKDESIKKLEDYIEKIQNKNCIKVLISDDDTFKSESIRDVVLSVFPKAKITRVECAKASITELLNNKYDILIQDMFLPINKNEAIDQKGGIYVLNQIKFREIEIKHCICSSDSISYKFMLEANFDKTPFINFSSIYFEEDLIEFFKNN